ncbi:Predicted glutamine synthetase [Phaffia rhodozyma]|uniref:Predicted glutamine synthetase n=1 Tax=Phaffia rhodozyma TaxID=264483 RepID=A0A0F7SWL8_PHARH|nr:Predicted glutamine synthetase [Phaffia rhodozyma]
MPHSCQTTKKPARSLHIAVILTDTSMASHVKDTHGSYSDIFRRHLLLSLQLSGRDEVDLVLDAYDATLGQYPSEDLLVEGAPGAYDGLLISGSFATVYQEAKYPWIPQLLTFLRRVGDDFAHVRMIGICFGLQCLTRAYGGEVVRNPAGWELGTYDINLTPTGEKLFGKSTVGMQQWHADMAVAPPPEGNFHLVGSSTKTPVHSMVSFYPDSDKVHMLAFQGHPEFNPSILNLIMDSQEAIGAFHPDVVRSCRERADIPHDGLGVLGQKMCEIFLGEA